MSPREPITNRREPLAETLTGRNRLRWGAQTSYELSRGSQGSHDVRLRPPLRRPQMWETLPAPIAVWLPAGSVHVLSSAGEITVQVHASVGGSTNPGPVQTGGPHRDVQFQRVGALSALSIV